MFDPGFGFSCPDESIACIAEGSRHNAINPGSKITLRRWTGKRLAAPQQFSPGATSGISSAAQSISHCGKISIGEMV